MKDTKTKSSKPGTHKGRLKVVATGGDETAIAEIGNQSFPEMSWNEDKGSMEIVGKSMEDRHDWAKSMGVENKNTAWLLMNQIILAQQHNYDAGKVAIDGAIDFYRSFEPKDNLECLLAAQMVATHSMAMHFSARAMLKDQTFDGIDSNINRATKLMRTYVAQVEALRKYRTGGKQTIQVQHINVNEGGQAVVGNIQGGGGNG